jgi:glutathione reductase (NADPH)
MARFDCDLFVIGAGSAGVRAARMAAGYGAKVAIAEESRVGGTCVIRGCVPKKLLVYAAQVREEIEDAAGFGWRVPPASFDWATLIANKDREIDRLNGIYCSLLAKSGVELIEARAVVVDPHAVEVAGRRISAATILVAVGAWPEVPPIPGAELGITSNEAFHLPHLPRRIVVVGAGYIAVEFAGIFHGLGAEVTEIFRAEQILRGFDADVRRTLAHEMEAKGIALKAGVNLHRLERLEHGWRLELDDGSELETDLVMWATGRRPHTRKLGLEEAGVALDELGAVKVDAWSQSAVPSIYAIGDCTNRVNLTPVAIREGAAFADTVYGGRPWSVDHSTVPSAVFSQPPIGAVGLTEEEARRRYGTLDIYKSTFRPLKGTLSGRAERTLMKLVVDRATQRVLGAHMVGPDAAEIIQGVAIAVQMGATKADFDRTVAIHPSAAEEFVTMRTAEPDPIAEAAE